MQKTFVIGILHQHGGELSTDLGRLEADTAKEALQKAELWIARKKKKQLCKSRGNQCEVDVREAYTGLKSTMLAASAEDIYSREHTDAL